MDSKTKVGTVALGGAVTAILFWLAGDHLPDAPAGVESAVTMVVSTILAWVIPSEWRGRIPRAGAAVLLGAGLAMGTPACATTEPYDAVSAAETLEQKTFALYGTFVWAEEVAADVAEDPDVPDDVALAVYDAVRYARPPVRTAFELAVTAAAIRDGVEAGDIGRVLAELETAYARARGPVSDLVALVKGR